MKERNELLSAKPISSQYSHLDLDDKLTGSLSDLNFKGKIH